MHRSAINSDADRWSGGWINLRRVSVDAKSQRCLPERHTAAS